MQHAATRVGAAAPVAAGVGTGVETATENAAERAFNQLFDEHYDFVWATLRRLGVSAEAADDEAQKVFLVAARKLADIQPGRERAFLHGASVRIASDARYSSRRRGEIFASLDDASMSAGELAADELLDQKRARELLDQILDTMDLDERSVFALYEIDGLTMIEIADLIGVPQGTVASRLKRAREHFERKLSRLQRGAR
jgi:RNA polymerase sigma-70 factor (ECF subfamily)